MSLIGLIKTAPGGCNAGNPRLPIMTATKPKIGDRHNSVPLDIDEATTAIENSRRRLILLFINNFSVPIDAGDLAEAIAIVETNKERGDLNSQDRKRVYISLIQGHLDTLDGLGVVVYCEQSKQVWPTGATAPLVSLIRQFQSFCKTDSYYRDQ